MSIFELSPKEFTALSTLIGFALLSGLTPNQQNALGNFLMGIGQVLETASAQQAVQELESIMKDLTTSRTRASPSNFDPNRYQKPPDCSGGFLYDFRSTPARRG